ncbi:hypothetical protein R1sor_005706 [Riccia sorocarpa]|uniref:MULE transposase domain-containing protein n=1 Tax=Riccia sorocarpa TaxID=122646 RepID=A0ABD3HKA3_9MARC
MALRVHPLEKLATLGHGSTVSIDATFSRNKYGYQLYTVLCFDSFLNGVPCMWFLMERHETEDLAMVFREMKVRVDTYRLQQLQLPEKWRPSCFLTDDAKEENLALSDVFPNVPVNLCLWHVRRAWLKKLHAVVKDPFAKAAMNQELGRIMYGLNEGLAGLDRAVALHPKTVPKGFQKGEDVTTDSVIRCLMLDGYSEVQLLHMLGTKWGTDAGGLQNMQPKDLLGNIDILTLGIPGGAEPADVHDESDDCIMLSSPPRTGVESDGGNSHETRKLMLSNFQREIASMYKQVSTSKQCCQQAYELVMRAINDALQLKAVIELRFDSINKATCPEQFTTSATNETTLKRKKDFLELYQSKRRRQHEARNNGSMQESAICDDNRFTPVLASKKSVQEELDKAAYDTLASQGQTSDTKASSLHTSTSKLKRRASQSSEFDMPIGGRQSMSTVKAFRTMDSSQIIILD